MQNTSGVVLVSYSAFKSNPPNEFKVNKEGSDSIRLPNNSLVTIISDKEEFTNTAKTNMVKTISDLEAFRSQILNRPLLLLVTCGKHVPHGQRLNNRGEYLSYRDPEWWIQSNNTPWRNPYARWGNENGTSLYEERYIRPEFVVSVDTSNPNIRRLLEDGLDMAEDMIREKASFAIEFDFNPMILRWWKTQGIKRYDSLECLEMTAAAGANFVITNCSAINHFFDCHPAWCACWPCYLLLAVPYKLWRNAVQGIRDTSVTMEGNAVSSSPGHSNYGLIDLHQFPVNSNQPGAGVGGMTSSLVPGMAHGIASHSFFPPPSLHGTLGNPRFKTN